MELLECIGHAATQIVRREVPKEFRPIGHQLRIMLAFIDENRPTAPVRGNAPAQSEALADLDRAGNIEESRQVLVASHIDTDCSERSTSTSPN